MNLDLSDIAVVPHVDGNSWKFKIICYGVNRSLGYAACTLNRRVLNIDDIRVTQSYSTSRNCPMILLKLLGKSINLRRRGIGTRLLRAVIGEAKLRGLKAIRASVTQADIDSNPYLLRWLEKHGFTIHSPDKECTANAVNKVHLRLGKAQKPPINALSR